MATASKINQPAAPEYDPWAKFCDLEQSLEMPVVDILGCWDIPYMEENLLDASTNGIESLQDEVDQREAQGRCLLAFAEVNQITLAVYRQMHDELYALERQEELPKNVELDPSSYFIEKYAPMLWNRRKEAGIFKGQDDGDTVRSTLKEVRGWFGLS